MICSQCPRSCGVDRRKNPGFCGLSDEMNIAHVGLHFGEEPCIGGLSGAGTVFFSGCALRCVFCQNVSISRSSVGKDASPEDLVRVMKKLEAQGAACIDLVNPTHFTSRIREALVQYKPEIPVVWNSSGYEKPETLRTLEGLVDVYLPDFKYCDSSVSLRYSAAPDYFLFASAAVTEMFRQTGKAVFSPEGQMLRGTLVRHLVLPAHTHDSLQVLGWLHEHLPKVSLSLMGQYFPAGDAEKMPEINRRLTRREYRRVLDFVETVGFDGYCQALGNADGSYVPSFDLTY